MRSRSSIPVICFFIVWGTFTRCSSTMRKQRRRELDLTLTGRDCGEDERAPMCGVPFHSAEGYIGRLIEKGYKVAICEQTEDPAQAKGLVRREVIRVITPGTLIETGLLSEQRNNYLCALYWDEDEVGIGFADVSTGQISATFFVAAGTNRICNELGTYSPSEVICNLDAPQMGEVADFVRGRLGAALDDGRPRALPMMRAASESSGNLLGSCAKGRLIPGRLSARWERCCPTLLRRRKLMLRISRS